MSEWRVAKSLLRLIEECNERWPTRSKASDGTIGDARHASENSDHNPWVKDDKGEGVVTAADITAASEPDVPDIAALIVRTLVARRDRRVKYLIHKGYIWRSYSKPGIPAWTPARYTGPNPHDHHVHVSVLPEQRLYDDVEHWGVFPPLWWHRVIKAPMHGPDVADMAELLDRLGYPCGKPLDICGPMMTQALSHFAHEHGLNPTAGGTALLAARLEVAHHR